MRRVTSLSARVALGAAASVAVGALVAATLTVLVLDRRLREDTEQRLRTAAETLVRDLGSERVRNAVELEPILDRRNAEAARTGIRLAVFEDGEFVAGDPWVRRLGRGRCVTRGDIGARVQSCGLEYAGWLLVASSSHDEEALQAAYAWSLLSAIGVAVLLGGLSSWTAARWAAAPVVGLARTVRELRPDTPRADALLLPTQVAEVEALRVALVELMQRSRSHLERVERFAANAAHELSTPLAVLRAELELLAEEHSTTLGSQLSSSVARCGELATLIERLLQLTAPADASALDTPVSLADVVERVVARLPAQLAARTTVSATGEALLRGDEPLLEALVQNAVENALKFSQGQVVLELVEVAARRSAARGGAAQTGAAQTGETGAGPSLRLRVSDQGAGITPELRERAFEPFFREKRDATPGHGLGLALIRSIAVTHGGGARFLDSEVGTTLEIVLPACDAP